MGSDTRPWRLPGKLWRSKEIENTNCLKCFIFQNFKDWETWMFKRGMKMKINHEKLNYEVRNATSFNCCQPWIVVGLEWDSDPPTFQPPCAFDPFSGVSLYQGKGMKIPTNSMKIRTWHVLLWREESTLSLSLFSSFFFLWVSMLEELGKYRSYI